MVYRAARVEANGEKSGLFPRPDSSFPAVK